jgi:GntR family transcriptional regulator of arabinose operon
MTNLANSLTKAPAYLEMTREIREAVENGALPPGSGILSERKLADKFKIAYITVRRGIQELVDEGLLVKIPKKGIFVSDKTSSKIQTQKNICVFMPELTLSIWARMLSGVEEILNSNNHRLCLVKGDNAKLLDFLKNNDVDGLIMAGNPNKRSYYEIKSAAPKTKIIIIGGNSHVPEADCVKADNEGGGFIATDHLLRSGIEKVIYLTSGTKSQQDENRRKGYERAMKSHKLLPEIKIWDDETPESLLEELDANSKTPTGFFCFSDVTAMKAINKLTEAGKKAPQDAVFVGFSNLEEAKYYSIPISSVDTDHYEMGRLAATELSSKLAGKSSGHFEALTTARLLIRESSRI